MRVLREVYFPASECSLDEALKVQLGRLIGHTDGIVGRAPALVPANEIMRPSIPFEGRWRGDHPRALGRRMSA